MRENNGEESGLTPKQVAEWLREAASTSSALAEYAASNGDGAYEEACLENEKEWEDRSTQVEAIAAWNTRHPDPVKAELVEALARLVRFGKEEGWNGSLIEQAESALKKVQDERTTKETPNDPLSRL